jgi:hypothetical protein
MEDKKTEKIKDENLNLSFVKICKNLNLGEEMKISTFRASASRAKYSNDLKVESFYDMIIKCLSYTGCIILKWTKL